MKPAPLALFVLSLVAATAWPLTSAIGAATARSAAAEPEIRPVGCLLDGSADDEQSAEELALPPGHPPIPMDRLPPGHPPISSGVPRLPPGHPPIPSGHPPIPSAPGSFFDAPVLLTI